MSNAGKATGYRERSPLVQLLNELPRYSDYTRSADRVADEASQAPFDALKPRFSASKFTGPIGARGSILGAGGSRHMRRSTSRLCAGIGAVIGTEVEGAGNVNSVGATGENVLGEAHPTHPIRSNIDPRAQTIKPSDSHADGTPVNPSVVAQSTLSHGFSAHLPSIKRPNLSDELRRQVLVNASTVLKEHERQQRGQERRVRSPARISSRTMRAGHSSRSLRVKGKAPKVTTTETGELTRIVQGLCHTEQEPTKVERVLDPADNMVIHNGNIELQEPNGSGRTPPSATTILNDTHTTGAETRDLRRQFAYQKISYKREALERAFGWHSQIIDDLGQVVRPSPEAGNKEETAPAPIGENVSGSEKFVGAVKVQGSIGSKGSGSALHSRGVDAGEAAEIGAGFMGHGTVEGGKSGKFQMYEAQIPSISYLRSRQQSQSARLRVTKAIRTLDAQIPSFPRSNVLTAKRSLQRFDRVEDWLKHQHDNNGEHSSVEAPNISTQTVRPATPKPTVSRLSHKATAIQRTPSFVSFERRYPLSLIDLPYLMHNLKTGGRSGSGRSGGAVTVSPPTDSDPLGYIHLDLKQKRYLYTIVPSSQSGKVDAGKYTTVFVQPRWWKGKHEEDIGETVDGTKSFGEQVYRLSELPAKHFSIVKFASKFIGIMRRETVVVRIEGLNSGSMACRPSPEQHSSASQWEWYRAEIYADGRFEFTILPRGGILGPTVIAENGDSSTDEIMSTRGVLRVTFTASSLRSFSDTAFIPRFTGSGGKKLSNTKLKRVHVKITRSLEVFPSSSSSKVITLWAGLVELGSGPTAFSVALGGVQVGCGDDDTVCAGFAAEVDWARRVWINCRKLLDKRVRR